MQILNISKLRNGIGILKKQENITENLTAEENRKEIHRDNRKCCGREETCTQTGTKECNSHKEENRRGSRERRKRRKG